MILNVTKKQVLAQRCRVAVRTVERMRGMIGRRFDGFDAMVFPHCGGAIHTCFMRLSLDVIFLDRHNRVVSWRCNLPPWRLAAAVKAVTVVEMPAGSLPADAVRPGDLLEWREG